MSDYDIIARKHFGEDYHLLTPKQHLEKYLHAFNLDPLANEVATSSLRNMDEKKAEEILLHFLKSEEALARALELIAKKT
ncbi:hypothetical protein HYX13_04150 [Candidatus Woesearchaeota archaeon]|nr:hypothetical protein [Candidatus Woesearchaeota archaeon]